jgi:hypothetical protein
MCKALRDNGKAIIKIIYKIYIRFYFIYGTRLRVGPPRNLGSISGRGQRYNPLRQPAHTSSGPRLLSYLIGDEGCVHGVKRTCHEASRSPPAAVEVKKEWR